MVKQRCIKINKNGTKTEKDFNLKDDNIIDGDDKVKFTPLCVFPPAPESHSKLKFWKWFKTKKSVMIFIEGALNALSFVEGDNKLQTHWNKEEAALYVKKMIALEAQKVKPIKTWQFIIIIALLMAILVSVIRLMMLMG